MTKVDLTPLKELFEQQGCEEIWPEVEQMLAPWVQIAERGEMFLKPECEIDKERYLRAVVQVTGQEVERIVFLSGVNPFRQMPWITDELQRRERWSRHGMTRRTVEMKFIVEDYSFRDTSGEIWTALWRRSIFDNMLKGSFQGSRFRNLWLHLWMSRHAAPWQDLRSDMWHGIRNLIYSSAGLAFEGNIECYNAFSAYLDVQQEALGWGFKKDEPTVFIALCA